MSALQARLLYADAARQPGPPPPAPAAAPMVPTRAHVPAPPARMQPPAALLGTAARTVPAAAEGPMAPQGPPRASYLAVRSRLRQGHGSRLSEAACCKAPDPPACTHGSNPGLGQRAPHCSPCAVMP